MSVLYYWDQNISPPTAACRTNPVPFETPNNSKQNHKIIYGLHVVTE